MITFTFLLSSGGKISCLSPKKKTLDSSFNYPFFTVNSGGDGKFKGDTSSWRCHWVGVEFFYLICSPKTFNEVTPKMLQCFVWRVSQSDLNNKIIRPLWFQFFLFLACFHKPFWIKPRPSAAAVELYYSLSGLIISVNSSFKSDVLVEFRLLLLMLF